MMSSKSHSENDAQKINPNNQQVEELRKLVLSDKQLISRTDDIFLLNFLRARKYDTARAFQLIKNYYNTRRKYPEIFKDLKPSSIQKSMDAKIGGIIIKEDFLLGIGRVGYWEPQSVYITDIVRNIIMMLDYTLKDDLLQEKKLAVLFDVAGLNWKHFLQLTPRIVFMAISSLYASYPIRYSQFHIINENKFFHALLLMILPMLPRKLKSRLHLHGSSIESLKEFIKPNCLPVEYGGELPPFDPSQNNELLRANEEFFIENEKFWTVEKQL